MFPYNVFNTLPHQQQLESSVASFDLESVLLELHRLKEFLDKNSQFSPSSLSGARYDNLGPSTWGATSRRCRLNASSIKTSPD